MDGYFLRDDDLIGDNSGEYKPFDLAVEDWKVSPTTDFTLGSPELHFSTDNLLARVTLNKEFKEEKTLGDCSSESWFSVLNTKEAWTETKSKSLQEGGYLNEQVVPEQGQGIDIVDPNNKSVAIKEIQSNFVEISSTKGTPFEISTNVAMESPLDGDLVPENASNPHFICDHKEQVNSREGSFDLPPAKPLFTFMPPCEEKNPLKKPREPTEDTLTARTSQELIQGSVVESLSCSHQNTFVENEDVIKTKDGGCFTSESELPAANVETINNLEIKIEVEKPQHVACEKTSEENDIFKIRKRLIKLLTTARIAKCTMVDYKFCSTDKLPSFAETFCPGASEVWNSKEIDIELPKVLQIVNEMSENEEEMCILLSDSDSDSAFSESGQDIEEKQRETNPLCFDTLKSQELPKNGIKTEVMEIKPEIRNNQERIQNADTPSSMLAIDDELEKFLVSSIVLNDTSHGNNSQLPDLSNNIGSILISEDLSEETSMEAVYGNLFSKPMDSIKTCKQEQIAEDCVKITGNHQGNTLNAGTRRSWQAPGNTLYAGSVWNGSVPDMNQANSSHFTDNIIHSSDPFLNNTDFKTIANIPANIMQTEIIDPFKFTSTAGPKVEVVDSSLNYGF